MGARVRNILQAKGHAVYSISPETTVYEALEVLVSRNVGALLVTENDRILGIFSERDYARRVILKGRSSRETPIRDIMTENPIVMKEDDSIEDCMVKMTDKHIRHLPITDHADRLVGVVSIGDLVKFIIDEQRTIIQSLEGYINGTHQ
ncbi:CBS domain-containing protein [Chitinophaga horti]|uniref:CBS domain-containing protein n=1 Tax=Chitinophaga horti TaxID=2920382 RepID=A0ABY6J5W6_9BACT|nr:CBS domain-containing protein [Chitinophaga horti]UYQ94741.1 CBS domain-containing protein [Chitinophaga horti]